MPLKDRQYKRLGRIARNNPDRAERVGERMVNRSLDIQRGQGVASQATQNIIKDEERKAKELKEIKDRVKEVRQKTYIQGKSLKAKIFGDRAAVGRDYPLSTSPTPKSMS